ncbi:MAG: response regulator transcription factor [Flavobacteriales bacterium]|nr:response regulator transcription factor [Flavobacteriales bacterium]
MKKISLLIVDDRDIIRDGLKLIFSGSDNINVKDEASDGNEAIALIEKNDYDVVLMDINMPNMNGIEATKSIKKLKSNIKVLANSFYTSPIFIRDMIRAGSSGFIKKGESRNSYIEAIESVHNGTIYLSDEVNHKTYDKVLDYLKSPVKGDPIVS